MNAISVICISIGIGLTVFAIYLIVKVHQILKKLDGMLEDAIMGKYEEKTYKTSEAQRKAIKRYRENHLEEWNNYQKKYLENHREELNEKSKKYYQEHSQTIKEKAREKNKIYREENKEKERLRKAKWYQENKERVDQKHKEYMQKRREMERMQKNNS